MRETLHSSRLLCSCRTLASSVPQPATQSPIWFGAAIVPNDLEMVASKANTYQALGNLQEAAKLLSGTNEQTPSNGMFSAKLIQLRLERNYGDAIRLMK